MVEFVSSSWTWWYHLRRLIFPINKNPKTDSKTLTMAVYNSVHENAIGYYRKLTNMLVIKNVQLFYVISARIMLFEFKKRAISWATYSAIWGLKTLGFDCFSLLRLPGIDWDKQRVLRMPLSINSIYHFSWFFSNLALLAAPFSNPFLGLPCLLMYQWKY